MNDNILGTSTDSQLKEVINMPKIDDIIIKNVEVFDKAKVTFFDGERHNYGDIVSDYTVNKFKGLLIGDRRIFDIKYINGLIPRHKGSGYISCLLDKESNKRLTVVLFHNDFEKCYYSFRVGNREAKIPLTEGQNQILAFISQFKNIENK